MTDTETEAEDGVLPATHPTQIASGLAFSGLMNVRSTEVALRWDGFRTALQLNMIGLVGIALWLQGERTLYELLLTLVACMNGISWNFFHYKLLGRDGKFLGLWSEKAISLERTNGIQGGVQIFSSQRYDELRNREPTVQYMLRAGSVFFIVSWVMVAFATILILLSHWRFQC
jgi:hypothetical protein